MKYVSYRRFKGVALCGDINIPAGTACEMTDGVIMLGHLAICFDTSENAHHFFTRDDDGRGMERGMLIRSILTTLSKRNSEYQKRWDKVWSDSLCQKYKRTDDDDYWLWNHDFYNAEIEDLEHIAKLVGAKGVK